jgi:hypothetical protein
MEPAASRRRWARAMVLGTVRFARSSDTDAMTRVRSGIDAKTRVACACVCTSGAATRALKTSRGTVTVGRRLQPCEKTRHSNCPYELKNRVKVILWAHEDKQNFREISETNK